MTERFDMIPASSAVMIFSLILGAVLLSILLAFTYISWSAKHVAFEVSNSGLKIVNGFYGREVKMDQIEIDGIRSTNLTEDTERRMKLRTNGIGLPGFMSGWFRLVNGEKCLAFVTDQKSVLYVPTKEGFSMLLSVADPDAVKKAIRTAAGR
jgi:hypothetical protein